MADGGGDGNAQAGKTCGGDVNERGVRVGKEGVPGSNPVTECKDSFPALLGGEGGGGVERDCLKFSGANLYMTFHHRTGVNALILQARQQDESAPLATR